MNIIHVSPMYYPALGGAEMHLKALSEGLVSRGHKVSVLTSNVSNHAHLWPGKHGNLVEREVINGVKVIRFPPDGGVLGSALRVLQQIRGGYRSSIVLFGKDGMERITHKPMLFQVIPYLLRSGADIVASMNWYWPPAYHVYLARKMRRFTVVGIPLFHTAEPWCHRTVYDRMLVNCDGVAVNTAYEAEFVKQRASTRVEVTGVGIHPGLFECRNGNEIRMRYGLGRFPIVGFVGRQAENKGASNLIGAMRTVWNWNNDVRLVLAGPRSHRHEDVEGPLQSLTGRERERIITINDFPEKDKASIYDSFDVFVLPSVAESFGISYLEAWLCKKPVIGGRIGSTRCVIEEGVDGLLADPNNPKDIGRAITELLSDPKKSEAMGQSGNAKTLAQFTWDKVTRNVEKLYLELCEENRKRRGPPFFSSSRNTN